MLVDGDSKEFLTINTHKGLFRYNHRPYGIPSTGVPLDNILIKGLGSEEHLDNNERVLHAEEH